MKRNGRARNGVEAKRRRARIARRLKLADERRAFAALILGLRQLEVDAFARMYRPLLPPEMIADLTAAAFAEVG